jgi:hypothetical protein
MRAATALCFWALAWRLAGEGRMQRLGDGLLRAEPYVFLMFCAHLILIWCAGPAIGQITGPLGAPAYPLFLLGQPVLALGGAVVLGQALRRVHPGLARVLSGGRSNRAPICPQAARARARLQRFRFVHGVATPIPWPMI